MEPLKSPQTQQTTQPTTRINQKNGRRLNHLKSSSSLNSISLKQKDPQGKHDIEKALFNYYEIMCRVISCFLNHFSVTNFVVF